MSTPPQWGFPPYILAALAAVLAIVLARRRVEHRPVALFLAAMLAIDLGRLELAHAVDFEVAPRPYIGLVRLAFHADELGFLAWPFGLAAVALRVFIGRRPWVVLGAYAALCVTLITLYPSDFARGVGLQRAYLVIHLVAVLVYAGGLARWRAKPTPMGAEHTVLLLLGAGEVVRLLSLTGPFVVQWAAVMPPANGVLYAVISAVEGVYLWLRRD